MGGEGILFSHEAMYSSGIIKDGVGNLQGGDHGSNLSVFIDGITKNSSRGELPFIQGLTGFLGTDTNAGTEG